MTGDKEVVGRSNRGGAPPSVSGFPSDGLKDLRADERAVNLNAEVERHLVRRLSRRQNKVQGKAAVGDLEGVKGLLEELRKKRDGDA